MPTSQPPMMFISILKGLQILAGKQNKAKQKRLSWYSLNLLEQRVFVCIYSSYLKSCITSALRKVFWKTSDLNKSQKERDWFIQLKSSCIYEASKTTSLGPWHQFFLFSLEWLNSKITSPSVVARCPQPQVYLSGPWLPHERKNAFPQ